MINDCLNEILKKKNLNEIILLSNSPLEVDFISSMGSLEEFPHKRGSDLVL